MFRIGRFQPAESAVFVALVEAIQEHERAEVPEFKPGREIDASHGHVMRAPAASAFKSSATSPQNRKRSPAVGSIVL